MNTNFLIGFGLCLLGMGYGLLERHWNVFNFCLIIAACCAGGILFNL